MEPLKIRRYEPSDYEAIWQLHNIALAATGSHVGNGWWDDDLHNIQSEYFDKCGEFLVGIIDTQIVAMGALQSKGTDRAAIRRMRTHPDFQGRGFGQTILETLEYRARELGYIMLELDTTVLQASAQRLYLRNGYKEIARQTVRFETIFYEKQL